MSGFLIEMLNRVRSADTVFRPPNTSDLTKSGIPHVAFDYTFWFGFSQNLTAVLKNGLGDARDVLYANFVSIDRGVGDWKIFKKFLDLYPALEVLVFDQNYSSASREDFLEFLSTTHVRLIVINDSQTDWGEHEFLHEQCPRALAISGATLVILNQGNSQSDCGDEEAHYCPLCDKTDNLFVCCKTRVPFIDDCGYHKPGCFVVSHYINGTGCTMSMWYQEGARYGEFVEWNAHKWSGSNDREIRFFDGTYEKRVVMCYWPKLKAKLVECAIGLQALDLPALLLQTIFEQSDENAELAPMYMSWNVIVCVKHYLSNEEKERRLQA